VVRAAAIVAEPILAVAGTVIVTAHVPVELATKVGIPVAEFANRMRPAAPAAKPEPATATEVPRGPELGLAVTFIVDAGAADAASGVPTTRAISAQRIRAAARIGARLT
jgi:hypothetical protein